MKSPVHCSPHFLKLRVVTRSNLSDLSEKESIVCDKYPQTTSKYIMNTGYTINKHPTININATSKVQGDKYPQKSSKYIMNTGYTINKHPTININATSKVQGNYIFLYHQNTMKLKCI
uniref:Uncharacterized protein LOC111132584 n=1 Tax=Crassostrea virginica TaxID=6565 RepID=A0A8B8E7K3_CRAVI|nr:uncharacterized protein LOC111132584 [Crassostrea virginica]